MRLTCPLCGDRDRREFYYYGAEDYLNRPAADAPLDAWDNYLHLRDNPAGETRDLWYHEAGCAQWLLVTRNTLTHAISGVELVAGRKSAPEPKPTATRAPLAAAKVDAMPGTNTEKKTGKTTATKTEKKTGPKT